ncbi:CDP-archaeol synthase [Verrucomicrobiaceae bacterium N1E253]|uniref:Phosphatidate cytidylyltransferase n=1 Tax=Oceaniferula marina TaxID=2748318 RepID=A0A851GPN8_9BACT|nr:CDP-archaeol synthase [Oceaniferula marina]NWK57085.1 CDP-archaeol synthase [Oceaniferula marina]
MTDFPPEKKSKAQVFASRLFSTLLLWAIVTVVFVSGNVWAFVGLMMLASLLGVKEFFGMTRDGGMPSQPKWGLLLSGVYLAVIGWMLGQHGRDSLDSLMQVDAGFVILAVMGGFLWQLRRAVDGKNTVTEVAITVLGFVYVAVMFSYIARLLFVPDLDLAVPGAWLVIWLVAVTKFTDMGAYAVGSMIGKHKMIPHISPGKTWQGLAGGIGFALLAGCGLFALLPEALAVLGSWPMVILLSLILAALAVVGDLAESVLKRSIGVKDSGSTLPGIGGILDLIDSLCFTAPALYFLLKLFPA